MAAASVIDTRNTISVPTFDGSDANWDAWRTKFEAYADLTGVGNYLEAAEAETDFISNGRMTEEPLAASTTLYALLVTKTDGKALSLVTLVPRRHGLEAWRVLKGEYEGRGGNRVAALLRGVLNPKARWEKMHVEGKDIFDMLTAWEKDVAQYRMASGSELQQEVQVATVLEHAPATYRDVLKIVPMGARQTYPALRAYLREWCLSQRGYDDLGMKTGSPMDVGQVKGKGKKGKGDKDKGKGKGDKGKTKKGGGKHDATKPAADQYFAGECGYCGRWGHKRADCKKRARDTAGKPGGGQTAAVAADEETSSFTTSSTRQVTTSYVEEQADADISLWIFAVASVGDRARDPARILVDSGADEHVCPWDYAGGAVTGPALGGKLFDAQGGEIERGGTRRVYLRLGPEEKLVMVDFKVASVNCPILSLGKLLRQGYHVDAGPSHSSLKKGDEQVTMAVHRNSLWVDGIPFSTLDGAMSRDLAMVAPVAAEQPQPAQPEQPQPMEEEPRTESWRPSKTARPARGSPLTYLFHASNVDALRARLRELKAPMYGTKEQLWRRVLVQEALEDERMQEEELLRQRRDELLVQTDPSVPRTMRSPGAPSDAERLAHELTHLPAAAWCEWCQLGRGVSDPHTRVPHEERDARPMISIDFAVRKAEGPQGDVHEDLGTFLAMVDQQTGCVRAASADSKGATEYLGSAVADFARSLFMGKFRLRSDGEPAVVAVCNKVKEKLADTVILETTPRHSSGSNGQAERAIRSIGEQLRTLRFDTQARYSMKLTPNLAVWP